MIVNKYNKGGGGSGSGTTYTAGEYISLANDVISVTGITPSEYLTSADTQDFVTEAYVDEAITAATSPIQEQLDDVERVTATALTELHTAILDLSGATEDFATEQYVDDAIEAAMTGSTPDVNLNPAFPRMPYFTLDNGGQLLDYVKSAIFDTYIPDGGEEPENCSSIGLLNTAFDWLDNNVDWEGDADVLPRFVIDPDEMVAYVENLPAGNYIFSLNKSQPGDNYVPTFSIMYWSKEEGDWVTYKTQDTSAIWDEPDFDIDEYWRNKFDGNVALTNNGEWFNWSFPKDVERFEIRISEVPGVGDEYLEINTTYKDYDAKEEVIASALTVLNVTKVGSSDGSIRNIIKISQAGYDALVSGGTVDPYTFYVITNQNNN